MFVIIMKWSEGSGSLKEKNCNKVGHNIFEGKLGAKGMKTHLSEVFWFPLCVELIEQNTLCIKWSKLKA